MRQILDKSANNGGGISPRAGFDKYWLMQINPTVQTISSSRTFSYHAEVTGKLTDTGCLLQPCLQRGYLSYMICGQWGLNMQTEWNAPARYDPRALVGIYLLAAAAAAAAAAAGPPGWAGGGTAAPPGRRQQGRWLEEVEVGERRGGAGETGAVRLQTTVPQNV